MFRRAISIAVAGAALAFAVNVEAADAVCISDAAKPSAVACAAQGSVAPNAAHRPGTAPRAIPAPAAPPPRGTTPPPPAANPAPVVPQSPLQLQSRALLVTQIQSLETLFYRTPKTDPDRPRLARRLAEEHASLESAARADEVRAEIARDAARKATPPDKALAEHQQVLANQAHLIMLAARRKTVDYYTLITNEYPSYPQLDEVLYFLAYEYEQAGDTANARKIYYRLIQQAPASRYIKNAYLAFGELFFTEAQGDPSKWDLAAQAYEQVLKFPPQTNPLYGYAWYKLAYVFWNKGELDRALDAFKKTVDFGTAFSQFPGASKLADSARRDVIPVYALKGDPGAAYVVLHRMSGDPAGSNQKTFAMMDDLGTSYLDTGHYPEAIALYKDLATRDKGSDRSCGYQAHVTEAVMAYRSGNKDAIKGALDEQLRVHEDFKKAAHPDPAKLDCASKTAALVVETAITWHIEAVGSSAQQRGTNDAKTMTLATYLYRRALDTWTSPEIAQLQFPQLAKEDWPTAWKIKYALADLAYFQGRWAECGPAFAAVVAEDPHAPGAAEASYAEVLCWQKLYETTHGSTTSSSAPVANDLKPRPLTDQQRGMIAAFDRYACTIHPDAKDAAGQEQLVEVKWARARTYFEARHWEEAAAAFREIAFAFAERAASVDAAELYLESLNALGTHADPPRPACFDDMTQDVPKLLALYCGADKAKQNEEHCARFARIQIDILRLAAQRCVSSDGSAAHMESCATQYLEIYRTYCKAPIDRGQPPVAEKCDELVYDAARAFQAGRLIAKAIATRLILIDPANKMDRTPLAKKAVYEIGGNYQAIAVYDKAAEWYERYAEDRTAENADKALSDAVLLRLGLGTDADVQRAIEDGARFQRNYGATKGPQAAAIAFAIGAHYGEKEEWDKAESALRGALALVDRVAGIDVRIQAHALLGRAYANSKNAAAAKAEYARVGDLWRDPVAGKKKIDDTYAAEDDGQRTKRLAKVLNAVGEALFFAADQTKQAEVDPLRFPVYSGSGSTADVKRHIDTKVKEWLERKMAAITKVEREYAQIMAIQPVAPPRWVIAAGSRVGLMWGDLVDDFRKAPVPKDWDHELRERYIVGLREKSEPIKAERAKPALVACLSYSVRYQLFDDSSRACETWLAENYRSEYHLVDELRGAPTLVSTAIDRTPPLAVGGVAVAH